MIILIMGLILLFLLLGIDVFLSILAACMVYMIIFTDLDLVMVPHQIIDGLNIYSYLAVPFFLMLGSLMNKTGITQRIVELSAAMLGFIKGGLAIVCIMAGMIMSTISGSANADAAALGAIFMPALKKSGYKASFSAAVVSSAALIGPIIPPSIFMILYGGLANVSVGRLFIGGIIPGILIGTLCMGVIYFVAKERNYGTMQKFSVKNLLKAIYRNIVPLMVPLIILRGIAAGWFTPTEAGLAGVVFVLGFGLLNGSIKFKDIIDALNETVIITSAVFIVVSTAKQLGYVITLEQGAEFLINQIASLAGGYYLFMLVTLIIYLILGCFMEGVAILTVCTPLFAPAAAALGIDLVFFGVVTTIAIVVGMVTPPFGLVMYLMSAIGEITIYDFCKSAYPFIGIFVLVLILITLMPWLVTLLPYYLMPNR